MSDGEEMEKAIRATIDADPAMYHVDCQWAAGYERAKAEDRDIEQIAYERGVAAERAKRDPGFIGTAMKLMSDRRADLRTQVEALPTRGIGARVIDGELVTYALVERVEVLALLGATITDGEVSV